jgi:hypothetical protein
MPLAVMLPLVIVAWLQVPAKVDEVEEPGVTANVVYVFDVLVVLVVVPAASINVLLVPPVAPATYSLPTVVVVVLPIATL